MVYFRFLSAQKLITPIMLATATAAMMATSVVIKGVSVGSGEGDGSGDGEGSGSIVPPDDGAGPTVTAVPAAELP